MVRDQPPLLGLILLGLGCTLPRVALRDIPVPGPEPPVAVPLVAGRHVTLLVDRLDSDAGAGHASVTLEVHLLPPQTTAKGLTARVVNRGGATEMVRSELEGGAYFSWQGTSPEVDAVEIDGRGLCLGRECEDLTLRLPVVWR